MLETLLEMERLDYRAGEKHHGAITLVLDLEKALERVSLPSCVGLGAAIFNLITVLHAGTSSTDGAFCLKGVQRSHSRPSRPSSLGQNGAACSFAVCFKVH